MPRLESPSVSAEAYCFFPEPSTFLNPTMDFPAGRYAEAGGDSQLGEAAGSDLRCFWGFGRLGGFRV